jgi:hypothetical protein
MLKLLNKIYSSHFLLNFTFILEFKRKKLNLIQFRKKTYFLFQHKICFHKIHFHYFSFYFSEFNKKKKAKIFGCIIHKTFGCIIIHNSFLFHHFSFHFLAFQQKKQRNMKAKLCSGYAHGRLLLLDGQVDVRRSRFFLS